MGKGHNLFQDAVVSAWNLKTIIDHYDLRRVCLPKQLELIERILK